MKGLLIKDLCILGKSGKFYLLYLVAMALLGYNMDNTSFVIGVLVMVFTILCITTFSYDDLARWPAYAAALPVSRRQVVLAKYILGLGMPLVGGLLSFGITLIYSFLRPENVAQNALIAGVVTAVGIAFNLLMLPATFKWGAERSRIFLYLAFAAVFAGSFALAKLPLKAPSLPALSPAVLGVILAVALVALGLLSYLLSCRIYAKKEF